MADAAFDLARLAAIVESSADAIIGKTLDGVITSWNTGAERMYGYTAGEMIGRNVAELIPADRAGELPPILARLRRGERIEHFDTKRRRKDGSIIDVSVAISPIRDAGGAVAGASTVARDMTGRNRIEAERFAMDQELHRVERLEILGQVAGGIAHDFNNLLAAIMSYAGFVAEETADRPRVRADAEQIQAAALRAAQLTRQLMIFSQHEVSQPEPLDVNAVVTGLRDLLSAGSGSHIDVRADLAPGLPAIVADRSQLEQVLLNLAANARDAMLDGGILTVGTTLEELDGEYARRHPGIIPGPYVELTVSDTGVGMSAEVAARIFEPFFTTKPAGRGTGLGLSTVHVIATRAGGGVSVVSHEGTGTTVGVCFPASTAAVPVTLAAATAATSGARGHGETVLVVDDEPSVLEVTARILRKNGYLALEAATVQRALWLASSHDFQLLLADSVMPGESGLQLVERVLVLRPGVRVLHMSGYAAGLPSPQRASGQGLAFLPKPFTAAGLLDKVRAVLAAPPGGGPVRAGPPPA